MMPRHSGPSCKVSGATFELDFFCQQIGCFFRCENYRHLLEHSNRGLHFRFTMERFGDTELERISDECNKTVRAVPTSRNAVSRKQDTQTFDPAETSTQLPSMPVRKRVISSAHNDVVSSVQGPQTCAVLDQPTSDEPCLPNVDEVKKNRKGSKSNENTNFKCAVCSKSFTRASTLDEHARTHRNERPFKCNECGRGFTRLKDRNRHQALHSGEKRFVCRGRLDKGEEFGCHKGFAREDGLTAHLHAESAFGCLEPLLDRFVAHMLSSTEGGNDGKKYRCHSPRGCGALFSRLDDLTAHFHSDVGRACMHSGLVTFALSYLDHRKPPAEEGLIRNGLASSSQQQSNGTETSDVSHIIFDMAPTHPFAYTSTSHSDMVNFTGTTSGLESSFDRTKTPICSKLITAKNQHAKVFPNSQRHTADTYLGPAENPLSSLSFGSASGLGLRIEGYTPRAGVAGDIMRIRVQSSVSLQCAVFSLLFGRLIQAENHLQRMNTIPASAQVESIAIASLYRYTISARIPDLRDQLLFSPVPVELGIEGLQKYGGKEYETLAVGFFVYDA